MANLCEEKNPADLARYIWSNCSNTGNHKYLSEKKISIGNCRIDEYNGRTNIVVPFTDSFPQDEQHLQIKTLQHIYETGDEYNQKGLTTSGVFYIASPYERSLDIIVVAVSFRDAQTIADATELCTIACAGSQIMKSVVMILPSSSKIVLASNAGESATRFVESAARELQDSGREVEIIRPFRYKNFNELLLLEGSDKVSELFAHLKGELEFKLYITDLRKEFGMSYD